MISKVIFVGLLMAFQLALADEPKYTGPKCLGPYCINKTTRLGKIFKELGTPPPKRSKAESLAPYCFQTVGGRRYAHIGFEHDVKPAEVSYVLLSDFPNCVGVPVKSAPNNALRWKTAEGIGLGSSEEDVLRAYGKPVLEEHVDGKIYRIVIHGWSAKQGLNPRIGEKRLFYTGAWDDLSAADFGIRDGKVSWIWLSYSE